MLEECARDKFAAGRQPARLRFGRSRVRDGVVEDPDPIPTALEAFLRA